MYAMDTRTDKMENIVNCAHRCLYFNEMLIAQCNSWLSAEEGNRNMEARILQKRKKQNKNKQSIK